MTEKLGVSWATLSHGEHHVAADAKKVLLVGHDGAAYYEGKVNSDGSLDVTVKNATLQVGDGSGDLTVDGTVAVSSVAGTVAVTDNSGSLTVDGTVAVSSVSGTVAVTDNSGSLTVDDGGSTLSVDDGGGALTVDGTVTVGSLPSVTVGATPAVEVADYEHASTAAASVPSGFTEFLEAKAAGYKVLHLFNGTEQPISFSFDETNTHYVLPAHSTMALDYKSNELKETSNLSYKYTSAAPTSGTVYGTAIS